MTTTTTIRHIAGVEVLGWGHHGYPYLPKCSCGWIGRPYASSDAAHIMVQDHRDNA